MTVKDTMISIALTQLHTNIHRMYEVWLEVGNGDMEVFENNLDKVKETFVRQSAQYLTDTEQTRFFQRAYEDTLRAVVNS